MRTWVIGRVAAAIGAHCRLLGRVPAQASAGHEIASLAFLAEAQVLHADQLRDGERAVHLGVVDLFRFDSSVAEGLWRRLCPCTDRDVAHIFTVLRSLSCTDDPHWLLSGIARNLGRGDD